MLAGLLASCAFFAVRLYEQKILADIPAMERPPWIPRRRFQKGLAHLAIVSALGYAIACFIIEKAGGKTGIFGLLLSLWFFTQAYKHLKQAKESETRAESS